MERTPLCQIPTTHNDFARPFLPTLHCFLQATTGTALPLPALSPTPTKHGLHAHSGALHHLHYRLFLCLFALKTNEHATPGFNIAPLFAPTLPCLSMIHH